MLLCAHSSRADIETPQPGQSLSILGLPPFVPPDFVVRMDTSLRARLDEMWPGLVGMVRPYPSDIFRMLRCAVHASGLIVIRFFSAIHAESIFCPYADARTHVLALVGGPKFSAIVAHFGAFGTAQTATPTGADPGFAWSLRLWWFWGLGSLRRFGRFGLELVPDCLTRYPQAPRDLALGQRGEPLGGNCIWLAHGDSRRVTYRPQVPPWTHRLPWIGRGGA